MIFLLLAVADQGKGTLFFRENCLTLCLTNLLNDIDNVPFYFF